MKIAATHTRLHNTFPIDTCTEHPSTSQPVCTTQRGCKAAMDMSNQIQRNIVVAVDASDAGLPAVQYAVSELVRPGDVLHVCHVATVLPPATSISHVAPQTTYDVPAADSDQQQLAEKVQAFIKAKFLRDAEVCEVPCFPHVYLETVGASADDIAALVVKTCEEVAADMLVVAHQEKDHTLWAKLNQSSVLKSIMAQSRRPLMVVKHYTPGLTDDLAAAPAGCGAESAADWLAGS